jgi:hypothetical protein
MKDSVDAVEIVLQLTSVPYVYFAQLDGATIQMVGDVVPRSPEEVVDNHHVNMGRDQRIYQMGTKKSRPTGNQHSIQVYRL